jgi:hypothetical protein
VTSIFGFKVEAPRLPSWNEVKSTVAHGAQQATQIGRAAVSHARNLGQHGVDLGRRAIADPEGTVRQLASSARSGIRQAETAVKGGIRDGVMFTGRTIGQGADIARRAIPGDSLAARTARGLITGAEQRARFTVGVAGGLATEAVGLVGVAGTVATSAAELQFSPTARAELRQTIASGVSRGGLAVADYARSVAADPSRVAGDIGGAATATWRAGSGFVQGQVQRHEDAFRRGEGFETIGMTTGQVASYFIPVGAGAKAAATTVRGAEAIAVGSARVVAREGGEAALRLAGAETRVVSLTTSTAAREAAEASGARLLQGAEAGGGTVRVARSGGVTAQDLAAASRQSGSEVALYRNLTTNERFVAVGTRTGVEVPQGSRLIAHTQPGTGAAAVRASVADEAALARLGQRSSVIIDQGGTAATRFRATEEGAALARSESGAVQLRTPAADGVSGADNIVAKTGETAATRSGKAVHKRLADERRASGEFDLVQKPITRLDGSAIEVPKRVDLKTGSPQDLRVQQAIPDAVNFERKLILDDKPLARDIAKDKQEMIRFIEAYRTSRGELPEIIAIQRYNAAGNPVRTDLYKPSDFLPTGSGK